MGHIYSNIWTFVTLSPTRMATTREGLKGGSPDESDHIDPLNEVGCDELIIVDNFVRILIIFEIFWSKLIV